MVFHSEPWIEMPDLWTHDPDNSAEVWRTLFSHAGPKAWNSLPHAIQFSNVNCDSFLSLATLLGVSIEQLELNWTLKMSSDDQSCERGNKT